MFKKLFISLIILSALTSDGTVVFSSGYYDLLVYAGCQSNVLNEGASVAPVGNVTSSNTDSGCNSNNTNNCNKESIETGFKVKYSASLSIKEPNFSKNFFTGTEKFTIKDSLNSKSELLNFKYINSFSINKELLINLTDSSPPHISSFEAV
ncbi:MAG: hypothetical protein Q8942_12085 [Bacillota bacterium]|nr:hypothetical protein [Bacillota bacterium]